ncbi:ATP-binding protein [Nocardia thailandica]
MQNPFVGRHTEIARLRAAVLAAAGGAGRLVLIGGGAGIGKSWLAERAAELAAEARLPVLRGFAVDDPGMPPLWPWRRAARGVPELAAALDTVTEAGGGAAAQRFRMCGEVADVLVEAAGPAGLLLVLEDLHWADPTSLALLTHVATESARSGLLVVATYREPTGPELGAALPALLRLPHTQSIGLTGLSLPEVRYWLDQQGHHAGADAVHRRTDGNPLLVRLILDAGGVACPGTGDPDPVVTAPGIRRLVLAQLDRLDPPVIEILGAASVLGERIAGDVLARAVEIEGGADAAAAGDEAAEHHEPRPSAAARHRVAVALDAGVAAGVLRQFADGTTGFVHALVRDAVYADLPPSRRQATHRAAALALAEYYGPDRAGLVAAQWRRLGTERARCLHWSRLAARAARAAAAHEDAIRFQRWAIDAAGDAAPPAERAALLVELARDEFAAGLVADSLGHCVAAGDLAERAGRPDLLGEAGLVVHGVTTPTVLAEVEALCARALPGLTAERDTDLLARLLTRRALGAAERGSGAEARELSARALELCRDSTDPDTLLDAIHARHLALSSLEYLDERRELAARAVALGTRAEQPLAQLWGYLWTTDAALQSGDMALVEDSLAGIERVAERRRLPIARWHLDRLRATAAVLTGSFDAAAESDAAAYALARRLGDRSLTALHHAFHGMVRLILGDVDRADRDAALAELGHVPDIPIARLFVPMMLALAGDRAEAALRFAPWRDLPAVLERGPRWTGTMYAVGAVAGLLDDREAADAVYRVLDGCEQHYAADGTGALIFVGSLARVRADNALTAGHLDAAADLYRAGLRMDLRIGAHPFVALGQLGLARTELARADPVAARAEAEAAAAGFRRLGMTYRLGEADRLLADIARATRAADPLTPREREVCALLDAGRSNREIASRLVLSERTVETHVRSILAKFGVANRAELLSRHARG